MTGETKPQEYEMKVTKRQLRRIIREAFTDFAVGHQEDARDAYRSNALPPTSSNWHAFAAAMDIGVLDLDEIAQDMGYKGFEALDISISPRGLSQRKVEDLAAIMLHVNGADKQSVYDAIDKPYMHV